MRARVIRLYENGIQIPPTHLIECEGEFGLDDFDNHTSIAFLYSSEYINAMNVIPELTNAMVYGIYKDHIRIRGYEKVFNDVIGKTVVYYNEWIVKIIT